MDGPDAPVVPAVAPPERVGGVLDAEFPPEPDGDVLDDEPPSEPDGDELDDEPPSDDVSPVAQAASPTLLASNVTAPLRASRRPSTMALFLAEIEANVMTVPTKVEPTPSVDELPTCQKTLHAWAPLRRLTLLSVAVMRVDPAWKMKTASGTCLASSVNVSVMANDSGDL